MDQILTKQPSIRDLRSFGLLIGGAFGAVWLYRYLVHGNRFIPLLIIAGVLVVLGTILPIALRYPYRAWMWAGEHIGAVTSRIILAVCYVLVVTPIALMRRAFVRDPLGIRLHLDTHSYFHDKRIQSASQLTKMF